MGRACRSRLQAACALRIKLKTDPDVLSPSFPPCPSLLDTRSTICVSLGQKSMLGSRKLIVDGLWECFCPGCAPSLLSQPIFVRASNKTGPICRKRSPLLFRTQRGFASYTRLYRRRDGQIQSNVSAESQQTNEEPNLPRVPDWIPSLSTEQLEAYLPKLGLVGARDVTRYLVHDRGVKPNAAHYQALIRANCDLQHGSATGMAALLEEMEKQKIPIDSGTLHAALEVRCIYCLWTSTDEWVQVLAVHPNHLYRTSILEAMRVRWVELSLDGWHDVVVGLLRERLIEMAIARVEDMREAKITIRSWLQSLLIYSCCDLGEFSAARRVAQYVLDAGEELPLNNWYYMLDKASRAFDHATTSFVWRKVVEPMYLNPATGICYNILITAARAGDNVLANEVLRVLSNRQKKLSLTEYEALIESLVSSGNIEGAFRILAAMKSVNIQPTSDSTRPILTYILDQGQGCPVEAWELLRSLRSSGDALIPIAAINVVLEAQILMAEDLDQAFDWFKKIPSFDFLAANTATYNLLIAIDSAEPVRVARTLDLFREMQKLGIPPDQTTWENVILAHLRAGDFEAAYTEFLVAARRLKHTGWVTSRRFQTLATEASQSVANDFAERLLALVVSKAAPLRNSVQNALGAILAEGKGGVLNRRFK